METRTTVDTAAARAMALRLNNNEVVDPGGVGHDWINDLCADLDIARRDLANHELGNGPLDSLIEDLERDVAEHRERTREAEADLAAIRAHCYGPGNESAMDQMLARAKAAEAEVERLRNELDIIANATPSQWEPDMRDQFKAWAQNRARHAAGLTPPPA